MLLSPKEKLSRVVAIGHWLDACWLSDMLVVAAKGLVDMEQEGKVLALLQMGLLARTLKQLRGQHLQLVVM